MSIRKQTHSETELIVIDGGSTDGTVSILQENSFIDKLVIEADKGIYDAMNKGIKLATGDVIGFLHSDDEFACKSILSSVAGVFEINRNISAVYGDLKYVKRGDSEITVRHWRSRSFHSSLLSRGWMPPHPTLYVKKRCFVEIGYFDLEYKISSDYDFILKLFSNSKFTSRYVSCTFIKMRLGGVSNNSLGNVLRKSYEDWCVLRNNGFNMFHSIFALFFKNLTKINQFFTSNRKYKK